MADRGRPPSATSLDMAYGEGYIAACRVCWQEVCQCLDEAQQQISADMQRVRRDNERMSGKTNAA